MNRNNKLNISIMPRRVEICDDTGLPVVLVGSPSKCIGSVVVVAVSGGRDVMEYMFLGGMPFDFGKPDATGALCDATIPENAP